MANQRPIKYFGLFHSRPCRRRFQNSIQSDLFFFLSFLLTQMFGLSRLVKEPINIDTSLPTVPLKKKTYTNFLLLADSTLFFLYLTPWGLLETTPVTRTKKKCINFISSSMTWGGYLRCVDASRKVKMVDSSWITKKERRKGIRLRGGGDHTWKMWCRVTRCVYR